MLKDHPKGIYVAFATNIGERFAFYIMMAVLSLFLQAKYGLTVAQTGDYYSWFYFGIYAMALLGGAAADWMRRYKSVILIGQILMIIGYVLIAMPFMSFTGSMIALFVIALGNGLFKGNLQVVLGQLYNGKKYEKLRDSAFLFFYMGINVGAFLAPYIATNIRDWWLSQHGFLYDSSLPALCHQFINNSLADTTQFQSLAQKVSLESTDFLTLNDFAHKYIQVFSQGYNWAFGLAAFAMLASLFVFLVFNKNLPDNKAKQTTKQFVESFQIKQPLKQKRVLITVSSMIILTILVFQLIPALDIGGKLGLSFAVGLFIAFLAFIYLMSTDKERPTVISLIFLFVITVFFWMVFNQNGLVLTQYALEYTQKEVGAFTYLFFDFESTLCIGLCIIGLFLLFRHKSTLRYRFIGAGITAVFAGICVYFVRTSSGVNTISPEIFQAFNPLFVLLLTPIIICFFRFLNRHGLEPSAPRKIVIGLIIAGLAFVLPLISSRSAISPFKLDGVLIPEDSRVSPYWLMGTYLMLTIGEIFLSPMGASFVSKVSPKRFQGLMQGGWLFTTAVGSKFLVVGSYLWDKVELYVLWGIFALICIVSAVIVFSIIKRLEQTTRY